MDKENKILDFVKKHKVKLALGLTAVAGTAVWLITKDKSSNYIDIPKPELSTGEWTVLQKGIKGKYTDCITGCAIAVDVTDLGKFGDALATVDGIDGREPIRVIFGTERNFK